MSLKWQIVLLLNIFRSGDGALADELYDAGGPRKGIELKFTL